jgi:hypothetical protein
MIVVATYLKLRSPFKLARMIKHAVKIKQQLDETEVIVHKTSGFLTSQYTISVWNSHEEIDDFYRSGAHLEAMKEMANLAKEASTFRYESDHIPSWKEAKKQARKGKLLTF